MCVLIRKIGWCGRFDDPSPVRSPGSRGNGKDRKSKRDKGRERRWSRAKHEQLSETTVKLGTSSFGQKVQKSFA